MVESGEMVMTTENGYNGESAQSRALVPAAPRALALKRILPAPITRNVAVGLTIGAAGTFFIKKMAELAAEDLYHNIRRFLTRRPLREESSHETHRDAGRNARGTEGPSAAPIRHTIFVRVIRVQQMSPPLSYFRYPLRLLARQDSEAGIATED